MGWFIFAVILFLIAVLAFTVSVKVKGPEESREFAEKNLEGREYRAWEKEYTTVRGARIVVGLIGFVLLFLAGLIVTLDSVAKVPPRNVGVQIHFGKAVKALPNGWHIIPPWDSVEKIDASVQTMIRTSDNNGSCITVRLANQTTACVDVTTQWNIDHNGDVVGLYNKYRSGSGVFHNVERNVVERKLAQQVLPDVFANFDPLAVITGDGKPVVNPTSFSESALAKMRAAVDSGIVIDSVTIGLVHYDNVTQEKLNAFAQALADTRIATQNKLTTAQQKLANDNLVAASSSDPGVKYQNCLNLIKDLAAKNQLANLPATFNCNEAGSSTPVIVGQK